MHVDLCGPRHQPGLAVASASPWAARALHAGNTYRDGRHSPPAPCHRARAASATVAANVQTCNAHTHTHTHTHTHRRHTSFHASYVVPPPTHPPTHPPTVRTPARKPCTRFRHKRAEAARLWRSCNKLRCSRVRKCTALRAAAPIAPLWRARRHLTGAAGRQRRVFALEHHALVNQARTAVSSLHMRYVASPNTRRVPAGERRRSATVGGAHQQCAPAPHMRAAAWARTLGHVMSTNVARHT